MNRRDVLATSGLALTAAVSGCLGNELNADPGTKENSNTDHNNGERVDSEIDIQDIDEANHHRSLAQYEQEWGLETADDATASTAIRVGSSSDSHEVVMMAEYETPPETTMSLQTQNGALFHEEDVHLSPASYVSIRFEEPESFLITLSTETHEPSIEVSESLIDCNMSTSWVLLRENGRIDKQTISTTMGCP